MAGAHEAEVTAVDGYHLDFIDEFTGSELDLGRWLPAHLPQWSSRAQAAARYELRGGFLVLRIDRDQPPWCPEFDGGTKVSSLQTGVFSGPSGTPIGQHRFSERAVVREPQQAARLYTPTYGLFEVRAKAIADPRNMVAFWMIGYEDVPEHSGEICVCEVFGRDIRPGSVDVGVGVHPFGDRTLTDDFDRATLDIDATEFHVYAAEWKPDQVQFFIDGTLVKVTEQSLSYPMQFMLGVYEFDDVEASGSYVGEASYPKEFVVDYVRGYRYVTGTAADE